MVGFARKIEGFREADFRLANHRLQPLGHLTAARNLSIRQALSYGEAAVPKIVPEIVPAGSQIGLETSGDCAAGALARMQRFFSSVIDSATG
jgi:predicted phage tail protein